MGFIAAVAYGISTADFGGDETGTDNYYKDYSPNRYWARVHIHSLKLSLKQLVDVELVNKSLIN